MHFVRRVMIAVCLCTFSTANGWAGLGHDGVVSSALDQYEAGGLEAARQISVPVAVGVPVVAVQKPAPHASMAFSMGTETYAYRYWERVAGENFMHLRGVFQGIFAEAIFSPAELDPLAIANHCIVQGRVAWAKLDYTGGEQFDNGDQVPLTMSGSPDIVTEWRVLAAKDIVWFRLPGSFYSGLGWRFLKDDSEKASGTFDYQGVTYETNGYKRVSQYIYWPTGVNLDVVKAPAWQLTLNGEFDLMISGTQWSYISSELGTPVKTPQKRGFGLRGGVKFRKLFTRWALEMEPYFRYWKINKSDWEPIQMCAPGSLCKGAVEPSNQTQEFGVKLGASF